ncbi:MAG: hypothetical protein ACP5KS_04165 [Candidatus Hydrogenedens sp.]
MKRYLLIVFLISFLFINSRGNAQTESAVLTVTLHPEEINSLGSGWKIKELNSEWYSSGKMLVLAQGIYTIEFKGEIKGWKAPVSKQVSLIKGKTTNEVGIYERLKGSLRITLFPNEVIDGGAQWRRAGQETWKNSGEVETDVPVDEYEIEFKKVSGWNVPGKIMVDLQADIINDISASYSREQGNLVVNISPQNAVKAGAMWRFAGETIYRASGITVTKDIGTYTIEFNDVPNWTKPASTQVNIIANEKVSLDVQYTPVTPQEGEGSIEGEGEGEGEGENPFPFSCGCNQQKGLGGIKQLLGNLCVLGMSFVVLGFCSGMTKNK